MRKLNKREQGVLYFTISCIIAALVFNFIIAPLIAELKDLNEDIARKTNILERHFRLMSRGESMLLFYENYKGALQADKTKEEITADLFEEVKGIARSLNLSLESIKPLSSEQQEEYTEVLLEVELGGNFARIFQFIHRLEESSSFIKISSLRLYTQRTSAGTLRCRIVLSKLLF